MLDLQVRLREREAHRRVSRGALGRRPLRRSRQCAASCGPPPCFRPHARRSSWSAIVVTKRPGPSRAPAAISCCAPSRRRRRPRATGANRRRLDRRHAWRHDQAGGGRSLDAAEVGEAWLRRRSSDALRAGSMRGSPRARSERVLASPKTYGPDDVLTPAALALAKLEESKSWPAAARLREAALDHLRSAHCSAARGAPGLDPGQSAPLRLRRLPCARRLPDFAGSTAVAAEGGPGVDGRHVEHNASGAPRCDLDLTTERRGSPHALVATKNEASYRRRAEQRRQDLKHVSALAG